MNFSHTPRALVAILALLSWPAFAKTGFLDPQSGMTLGLGTYEHSIAGENLFDPVPALAPSGTTIAGSDTLRLLPAKIGFFTTRGNAEVEGYFRYMLNQRSPWTASGGQDGTGYTTFRSYGAGLNAGVSFLQESGFQMKATLNAEYVLQRASIEFRGSSTTDTAQLATSSVLTGAGIQPELWLGDLWVLSLFAGYQYGFARTWNVSKSTTFMGRSFSQGGLDDANGVAAKAQFGGFLAELALKLNFYK
ncbi:MAG: hypothetical protein ABIR96_12485 [Bdellovibrionota bacterium]